MKAIYTVLLLLMVLSNCSTGPDPETPLQTRILEVRVEPNPVAVGDTATFMCIIADSLDERFTFGWLFDKNSAQDTITNSNTVQWLAPDTTEVFNHSVTVNNGTEPDSVAPGKTFTVNVVE